MVEIFKTDVGNGLLAQQIIEAIQNISKTVEVSFDLEDCDGILRVVCTKQIPDLAINIIDIVNAHGCSASLLHDDISMKTEIPLAFEDSTPMGLGMILRAF